MSLRAALACVLLLTSCAKEGGGRPRDPGVYPTPPMATAPPLAAPAATPTATQPTTATAPAATATATVTASATASSATMSPKELFRAQDACLDHCDQFACMKVANAYRQGAGVPSDVLAGRRYAIHACLECGAPGLAIVDQCPSWGVSDAPGKKK